MGQYQHSIAQYTRFLTRTILPAQKILRPVLTVTLGTTVRSDKENDEIAYGGDKDGRTDDL